VTVDPTIPVFRPGYGPIVADFNSWIQAPFTFLTTKVMFRAEHHSATAMSAGVATVVPYDTVLEDPFGGWNSSTHAWTCPTGCSGWYEISGTSFIASTPNVTSIHEFVVFQSGTEYAETSADWSVNGHASGSCGSVQVPLLGGIDTIQGAILSITGVNTSATAGQYSTLEIAWISL
jgi:hypothetical protein